MVRTAARFAVPRHDERDLEQRKPCKHIGGGNIALVRVEFLVAEVADAGLIPVSNDHALMIFCQLENNVVTVRPAPENAVFYRSFLLKRGFLRHDTEDVTFRLIKGFFARGVAEPECHENDHPLSGEINSVEERYILLFSSGLMTLSIAKTFIRHYQLHY
jgi:hypothetical protein